MIKRFVTWLYVKFVVLPELQKKIMKGERGRTEIVEWGHEDPYEHDKSKVRTRH